MYTGTYVFTRVIGVSLLILLVTAFCRYHTPVNSRCDDVDVKYYLKLDECSKAKTCTLTGNEFANLSGMKKQYHYCFMSKP